MGVSAWDTAEILDNEETIEEYLRIAFESGDSETIVNALSNVAKARSMTQLAKDAGLSRSGLYKALASAGSASFSTIMKISKALGVTYVPKVAAETITGDAAAADISL
ncbi:MAG: putative addiction module antidote protein [Eggerthellaceae bacterium]|nr:putative addiction module antidote protein [Eggerthellaceae bacterium]